MSLWRFGVVQVRVPHKLVSLLPFCGPRTSRSAMRALPTRSSFFFFLGQERLPPTARRYSIVKAGVRQPYPILSTVRVRHSQPSGGCLEVANLLVLKTVRWREGKKKEKKYITQKRKGRSQKDGGHLGGSYVKVAFAG